LQVSGCGTRVLYQIDVDDSDPRVYVSRRSFTRCPTVAFLLVSGPTSDLCGFLESITTVGRYRAEGGAARLCEDGGHLPEELRAAAYDRHHHLIDMAATPRDTSGRVCRLICGPYLRGGLLTG
jgi:hypothetical protein